MNILLFTVASVLCSMVKSLGEMVIFRVIQGAGVGGIAPISQAIMMESFPEEKRGAAMAVFDMGVIIAPIGGSVFVESVQTTTAALSQYTHISIAKHMAGYYQ